MAAIHQTDPIYAGDTLPAIPVLSFATPQPSPAVSARLVFFKAGQPVGNAPATGTELTSSGGGILITDPVAWSFSIPPCKLPLDPGEWSFRFRTTAANGTVRTWLTGTLTIL
jgi:hypothetical protein